jgi:hypothetical protein
MRKLHPRPCALASLSIIIATFWLSLSEHNALACTVEGTNVSLARIRVPGAAGKSLEVVDVSALEENSVTAILPKRPKRPVSLRYQGAVEFSGFVGHMYFSIREPVLTADAMLSLQPGALVLDAWSEGDHAVATVVLDLDRDAQRPSPEPLETFSPVRLPCSALGFEDEELSQSFWEGTKNPFHWASDAGDMPEGLWRVRGDAKRVFLRPSPRWDAPRTLLVHRDHPWATWTESSDDGPVTNLPIPFAFTVLGQHNHWLNVQRLSSPRVQLSGWIHRSVLEPFTAKGDFSQGAIGELERQPAACSITGPTIYEGPGRSHCYQLWHSHVGRRANVIHFRCQSLQRVCLRGAKLRPGRRAAIQRRLRECRAFRRRMASAIDEP